MRDTPKEKTSDGAPTSVYPVWLAFVCAGLCYVAAGYLGTTTTHWREVYEDLGIVLPWIQSVIIENPIALPLGLVALGCLVLGLTQVRLPKRARQQGLQLLLSAGAVCAALSALGLLYANSLVFTEMQKALQQ